MLNYPVDFTSFLNILLAAIYQLINIRVDPFGTLNIITTPRIIGVCILTWVLPFVIVCPLTWGSFSYKSYIVFTEIQFGVLLLTGLCYILLYRAVSRDPSGINLSEQRKQENKTIFRTISLVYLTTLVPRSVHFISYMIFTYHGYVCLTVAASVAFYMSAILNTLVYWWRQKDFRSVIAKCRRTRVDSL